MCVPSMQLSCQVLVLSRAHNFCGLQCPTDIELSPTFQGEYGIEIRSISLPYQLKCLFMAMNLVETHLSYILSELLNFALPQNKLDFVLHTCQVTFRDVEKLRSLTA